MGKPLVTFNGWDGKWWRRIKVGKAVWDAANFVMPLKWSVALWAVEEVTGVTPEKIVKRLTRRKRVTHRRTRKAHR